MSHDCVLLVDDEPETVHLLRFALERAGYEVLAVERADDALRVAQEGAPDIVLLALEIGQRTNARQARRPDHEQHNHARPEGEQHGDSSEQRSGQRSEQSWGEHSGQQGGEGLRVCRLLRLDPGTRHLPIILVTGKLRYESDTVESFRAGADDYVMKPFRPAEVVARVGALLERARRGRDVSPLSGLPGKASIENQLRRLITSRQPFGALYASLDNFKTYNEWHGMERGDEVLQAVAYCVGAAVAACCPDAFVGHTDGDTFVVTTAPAHLDALAQEIIARFDEALPAWYPPADAARSSAVTSAVAPDERGAPHGQSETVEHSLLSLSIAGATNEKREFRNPLEVAAVAAEIKKALRARPGSNYLKDRRTGRDRDAIAPPQLAPP